MKYRVLILFLLFSWNVLNAFDSRKIDGDFKSLCFSDDNKHFILSGKNSISVFDITGTAVNRFEFENEIQASSCFPGQNMIVVREWNLQVIRQKDASVVLEIQLENPVSMVASTSDSRIVVLLKNRLLQIYDESGLLIESHEKLKDSSALYVSGNTILTSSRETDEESRPAMLLTPGRSPILLSGNPGSIKTYALSADHKIAAGGSLYEAIVFWETNTGKMLRVLRLENAGNISGMDFTPDSKYLIAADRFRNLHIIDVMEGKEVNLLSAHTAPLKEVRMHPGGKFFVTIAEDHSARIWSISRIFQEKKETENFLVTDLSWIKDFDISRDGRIALLGPGGFRILRGDKEILRNDLSASRIKIVKNGIGLISKEGLHLIHPETGKILFEHKAGSAEIVSASMHHDSGILAFCSSRGITLFDIQLRKELKTITPREPCRYLAWKPDGKEIFSIEESSLTSFLTATGESVSSIPPVGTSIQNFAVSPDGKEMAMGFEDGALRLFSLESGRRIRSQRSTTEAISSIAYEQDGKRLIFFAGKGLWIISGTGEILKNINILRPVKKMIFVNKTLYYTTGDSKLNILAIPD